MDELIGKDEHEYLKDQDYFSPNEAAYRWNLKRNTVIAALNRGRFNNLLEKGWVKKFTIGGSSDWYISANAMREVFGPEDKVQIIELWNKVGVETEPRKSICFFGRNVYLTDEGEDVPVEVLEEMRGFDTYREARGVIAKYIASKNGQDYVIRVETISLEDRLMVNYTDFFDAHRMNNEAHQNEISEILRECRETLHLGKLIEFYRISRNILSKEEIVIKMGLFQTIDDWDKFEKDIDEIQSFYPK